MSASMGAGRLARAAGAGGAGGGASGAGRGARLNWRLHWPPVLALLLSGLVVLLLLSPGRREVPATVLGARMLVAHTSPDGTVLLTDAGTGARVALLPGDRDSFVRGVLHGTERIRKLHAVPDATPYRLEALSDGRLVLLDTGTGVPVELEAFGPDNAASFAALLGAPPAGTARDAARGGEGAR